MIDETVSDLTAMKEEAVSNDASVAQQQNALKQANMQQQADAMRKGDALQDKAMRETMCDHMFWTPTALMA